MVTNSSHYDYYKFTSDDSSASCTGGAATKGDNTVYVRTTHQYNDLSADLGIADAPYDICQFA